ncbi:MAG: ABC transporter ATP-binding protein/permease [Bryobacteraceae bacterium]|nr:ABC transporter ATP-binding protein/permease [Bryobacteraceae bacterium]MDW8377442.1 ABC transporter ATP-binding protein [Bryobacterales bacterium]
MSDLRRLLGYAWPYRVTLAISVLLMALAGAAHAMLALLIRPVFDRVLNPNSDGAPVLLTKLPIWDQPIYLHQILPFPLADAWQLVAAGILAVFLVRGIADYCGNYLVNRAGLSAVTDMRQQVFDCVLRQDAAFFEANSTGRVMSSIMSDVEKIQLATSHLLADWLRQTFSALGLLVVVLQMDWKLALVSLTLLPFVFLPTVRIGQRLRRATRRAQDDAAQLNQILQETLSGHYVVKSFCAEAIESQRFRKAASRLRSSNLRYVAQQALASPIIELFGAITIVALLSYARNQIQLGKLTTGEFTSFVLALLMLYEPVKRLTGIHNIFQQALGAAQKVFEYLDRESLIQDKPGAVTLSGLSRCIEFDHVSFRYPASSPQSFALYEVSLRVEAGQMVALVGPSGAGKSTLASLLMRFYDVTGGAIRIDGLDIRDVSLVSLRRQIGVVAQDTFLFNDTVANNIRYGNPNATFEQVRQAARSALAEEFIARLPQGYDTPVGERGVKLSGGQRQRIAIARALLKNAPILILDEATSHLDAESEMLVQGALSNLMNGRTVIVIAHRLSTIRRADSIVVLDQGRIVETGRHEQLVRSGGAYQRLYELQFFEMNPAVNG